MSLALVSRKAALLAPWLRNPLWALARAVPSLDLRFAESKSLVDAVTGQNLVTFTRAAIAGTVDTDGSEAGDLPTNGRGATYFDSEGVMRYAAPGAPRFDHDPTTGESLGLLVEEQRTNSFTHSESLRTQTLTVTITGGTFQNGETVTATGGGTGTYISASSTPTSFAIFNGSGAFTGTLTGGTSGATATISASQAEWVLTRSTTSPDVVTAPSGSVSADKLVEDTTASNTHIITSRTAAVVTTSVYALSVFLKAAERTWALVNTGGTPFGTNGVYIDLSTGALGSTVGTLDSTPTVQNCGNGWYRVTITKTPTTNGNAQIQVRLATGNGTTSYTGDGTSGLYVWGAQFETGAFPTSYIPTTAAAATRAADVATDTTRGAALRALYAQFRSPASGTRPVVSLDDNSANERIELFTSGTDPKLLVTDGGSAQADIDAGAITANITARLAARFNTDNFAASVSGGAEVLDATGTMPTVDRVRIGRDQAGDYLNGTIARITGWDAALPTLPSLTQ